MTFPAIVLGFVIATLFGALFHLWKDGGFAKLVLYQLLSWSGFVLGHFFAHWLSVKFLDVGPLHVGFGILGSIVMLFFGNWLSLINNEPKGKA
ncbi:MAG: hypothetical protein MUO40_01990 [Anaerolineaceae bacterium]|nr:hypothetical protein [Anaerolineaceae bacterium]